MAIAWKPGLDRELLNANGAVSDHALGYQYTIQTTTQIRARVIEQVYYEIAVADFIPVEIGTGAYMEDIKTNIQYANMGSFASGLQGVSSGPTSVPQVHVSTSPKTTTLASWAFGYQYSTPEVQKALASNNWNVIEGMMKALKKRWDLGIQETAFLGLPGNYTLFPGLFSNADVTVDTAVINSAISSMSYADFATFISQLMAAYFSNSGSTKLPDHFIIPMSDFLGLSVPVSPQFPNISKFDYLDKALKQATGNPNFVFAGNAYLDQANNIGVWTGAGSYRYCLYRNNEGTMKMDIPVPFTLNPAATSNNYQWNGVSCGQFSGLIIFKTPEVLYFDI